MLKPHYSCPTYTNLTKILHFHFRLSKDSLYNCSVQLQKACLFFASLYLYMACNLVNRRHVLMMYQPRSHALSPLSEPGIEDMTYPDLILSEGDLGSRLVLSRVAWVTNHLCTGWASGFIRKVSFDFSESAQTNKQKKTALS